MYCFIYLICSLVLKQSAVEKRIHFNFKDIKIQSNISCMNENVHFLNKKIIPYSVLLFKMLNPKKSSSGLRWQKWSNSSSLCCFLQAQHFGCSLWICCLRTAVRSPQELETNWIWSQLQGFCPFTNLLFFFWATDKIMFFIATEYSIQIYSKTI